MHTRGSPGHLDTWFVLKKRSQKMLRGCALALAWLPIASALCPMMRGNFALSAPPKGHPEIPAVLRAQPRLGYAEALKDIDFDAVRTDLKALFTASQVCL